MAAGDIFNPTDPTKKPRDPNAPQGGDIFSGGPMPVNTLAPPPAPTSLAAPAQMPINTLAPAPGNPTGGGDMTPQQASAAGLGWVDKNNPNYGKAGFVGSAPAAPAAAPAVTPGAPAPAPAGGDMTPQQAAAAGLGWVDKNNPNYGKPGFVGSQPAAPSAPGTPAPTPGAAPAGSVPLAAAPDTNSAFKDALMKLLNPSEVSVNSAELKPALDANKLAEQRNFESNRNLLAERAAANGTNNSGGFETGLMGLAQDRAQREGQFAGDAVTHAKDQQTASLLAALGIGGNYNAANADRAQKGEQFGKSLDEQKREADIDAEMKRLGISSQTDLGNKDLSLRDKLGSGQLNLGLLSQLIGNSNAKDSLGATLGMHNQDAILKLLGMA